MTSELVLGIESSCDETAAAVVRAGFEVRSSVVHSQASEHARWGGVVPEIAGRSHLDRILPVVPMFHANAWGLAHVGVACGATLVMPGPDLSPPAIATLMEEERVTVAAGVPTIWMGVLPELKGRDLSALRSVVCGGSAVPRALSEAYREQIGHPIYQAWGMTETSPVASVCHTKSYLEESLDEDQKADVRASVGIISFGVDFRVVDPVTLEPQPWDGTSRGELQVAGPWIARAYYNDIATFFNTRLELVPDRFVAALAALRPFPLMERLTNQRR